MSEWSYGHDGVGVCIMRNGKFVPAQDAVAALQRLERIEATAQAWQAAWDAAEAFQRHEHVWADGTIDHAHGLWQTETERALDLKATLEAK
jgi:hypothetical protein